MRAACVALIVMAGAAGAQTFTPPAGCQITLTAQNRGCSVAQYYRCDSDPDGYQRSALFDRDGLAHLGVIDAETRWIETQSPRAGITDRLETDAENHASLSELLATGRDDFDFWTRTNDGMRLHHQGWDRLTGATATISGQVLDQTEFHLTTRDEIGQVLIERRGTQFISRDHRRFFGGVETVTDWTGAEAMTDDSPVSFALPAQPGFGSTKPLFDCDQLLTQLSRERAAS
ncbi:hypothetical protein [Paracoccus sp. (in: a-proteobacteria)]|uniref:hypothetical protein n=1 Tax=Paracoccus sp. TaxID=267 RepID=UPI0026DF80AB|nr:hypothetical protein [Paracoccus sp. (in: a-proteobacteria)]MDO5647572.1 hypothetical protein [Paracoccus sp. (in: a-proteobacteria)]